jgi:hypothetical protein
VTAQVANERVDVAALTFPFDCEQSHLRAALGAGNRKILKIKGRVVVLVHERGHGGSRPNQAAKTQMTVVTTSATNDMAEADGPMRLPEAIGGSAAASLSHRRLQAEPWPVIASIYAQSARGEAR